MSVEHELLGWFERHGRAALPWRTDRTPYRVLVSEFMLQQTQVERVVPAFEAFVARWPSFAALAEASQADVVRAWRGLGYNSRAVRLHRLAKVVVTEHGGALPRDEVVLRTLPGIGSYTARAVRAFAFDAEVLAPDTNVRRIVHRVYYGMEWPPRATAAQLDAAGAAITSLAGGYTVNSALMDLGATLCTARAPKCLLCPLQTMCVAAPIDARALTAAATRHARTQAPQEALRFEATTRYVRGRIVERLRTLPPDQRVSFLDLYADLKPTLPHHDTSTVQAIIARLADDGIIDSGTHGIRLAP